MIYFVFIWFIARNFNVQKNNNQEMLLVGEFRNCVTNKKYELCKHMESYFKNAVFRNEKHMRYKS